MNVENIFGERIKAFRVASNMTQQQLGDVAGLSKQAINDIEKGRRGTLVSKAILIANHFNTTVEHLCGATDNPSRDGQIG